jgi:hypothetical protein
MSDENGHRRPLIYRSLGEEEWPRAAKILIAHGMHVPHAKLATAHVAETPEGAIAAMGILQMVPHAEPWVVEDGWHGRVDLLRIERLMASRLIGHPILPGYVLVAVDERQAALAELAGFRLRNGTVYVKDFAQAEAPHA